MKRKKPKKDRESAGRDRETSPESARRLRELYERGMAELEQRQKLDPSARWVPERGDLPAPLRVIQDTSVASVPLSSVPHACT